MDTPVSTVTIQATIPTELAEIIKRKSETEGVSFADKCGHYILIGIEAERFNKLIEGK